MPVRFERGRSWGREACLVLNRWARTVQLRTLDVVIGRRRRRCPEKRGAGGESKRGTRRIGRGGMPRSVIFTATLVPVRLTLTRRARIQAIVADRLSLGRNGDLRRRALLRATLSTRLCSAPRSCRYGSHSGNFGIRFYSRTMSLCCRVAQKPEI